MPSGRSMFGLFACLTSPGHQITKLHSGIYKTRLSVSEYTVGMSRDHNTTSEHEVV